MSAQLDSDSEYHGVGGDTLGYGSNELSHRFPVHDACEFHDAEFLRKLIFVRQDEA